MRHLCRRTTSSRLSCDAHNKGQRVVRGQAVGFSRRSRERVRMGLTATGRRSFSRLGIDPLSIAGPLAVVFGWDIDAMPVACQLLHRERGLADSAGHTQTWPPNLCLPPPQEVRMMYASA